jgi:monofunctional chorismate mutase
MSKQVEEQIVELRKRVDEIDQQIVKLLNQRAEIVLKIRRLKSENQLPLYDPEREEEIFEKVTSVNAGPLYDDSLREIYERILQCMKSFD